MSGIALPAAAVLVLLVLLGILLGRARRRAGRRDKGTDLEKLRRSGHYWGVRIRGGRCDAIRPFLNRRFGLHEAPTLPRAGCKAWRCTCTYIGLPERRLEERRVQFDRRSTSRLGRELAERRSLRERRRQDKARKDPAD